MCGPMSYTCNEKSGVDEFRSLITRDARTDRKEHCRHQNSYCYMNCCRGGDLKVIHCESSSFEKKSNNERSNDVELPLREVLKWIEKERESHIY